MGNPAFDYRSLSGAERLQLVGDIWDSIVKEANAAPSIRPLTKADAAELDRRLAEHELNPAAAVPLEESLERIRARFRRS